MRKEAIPSLILEHEKWYNKHQSVARSVTYPILYKSLHWIFKGIFSDFSETVFYFPLRLSNVFISLKIT